MSSMPGPIRESTRAKYRGTKHGKLVVLDVTRRDPRNTHHHLALVRCECGTEKEIWLDQLRRGTHTLSCGCLGREARRQAHIGHTRNRHESGEYAKRNLFQRYRRQAEQRGLGFDLTLEQFVEMTSQSCFYCGAQPSNNCHPKGAFGGYVYNGLDRADNALGYTMDNCVASCMPCNGKKNAITKEMIEKLYHKLFPSHIARS